MAEHASGIISCEREFFFKIGYLFRIRSRLLPQQLPTFQTNTVERAYAMTNPQEFFAENTEAFFSCNDYFPFTRDELKQHDPETFALLEKLWNLHPEK